MLTLFFTRGPVRSWGDARTSDTRAFARWHGRMLERAVYWPPAQFEAAFVGGAHSLEDVEEAVKAAEEAF